MSRGPGPLARRLLAAAGLLLLAAMARCEDEERSGWKPFRPTAGDCHEIRFMLYQSSDLTDGPNVCQKILGSEWRFSRTEAIDMGKSKPTPLHYCRRCGLPRNPDMVSGLSQHVFGRANACYGSCPSGWQTLTPGVMPETHIYVDPYPNSDGSDWYKSKDFGNKCDTGTGKVLCALGGRPASAQCSYTWRGTAPDCRDACEPGETLVAKDWYGEGRRCLSGTYNKMLCERCQTEILNLNDCTTPTWFGTAPLCAGECNVGDRVMARAEWWDQVPSDQDPDGFGKACSSRAGYKVRCHLCSVRGLLGSGREGQPKCSPPKAGHVWQGSPVATFSGVKTYEACCQECRDAPECRRFHVGATGCFLFVNATEAASPVSSRGGRAGGASWQAGTKLV